MEGKNALVFLAWASGLFPISANLTQSNGSECPAGWWFAKVALEILGAGSRPIDTECEPDGGYCAWAVSQSYTVKGDPQVWTVTDGKLYLNYNKSVQSGWEKDTAGPRQEGRR